MVKFDSNMLYMHLFCIVALAQLQPEPLNELVVTNTSYFEL